MKTQSAKTLKIRRELAWLSLLKSSRGKTLIYSTVCHIGIPGVKPFSSLGLSLVALHIRPCIGFVAVVFFDDHFDKPQKDCRACGEVEIRTTKQAMRDIATLGRALNKACGFEV
ncbi:hypothetical protein A9762_11860 [Pandoraea sp. ISTKB]|nr:hypothetical protein A9762_11860 [Pandoraea sp. ISTKB]